MSPRGRIELVAERCTSCMLCVRECPTWCITLEAHQEAVGDPGARRPRTVNVLDGFTIDWGLCMYCGLCVESCPSTGTTSVMAPVDVLTVAVTACLPSSLAVHVWSVHDPSGLMAKTV